MATTIMPIQSPPLPNRRNTQSLPAHQIVLVCVSGPDVGRQLSFVRSRICFGRSAATDFVSRDAGVRPEHVVLVLNGLCVNFLVIADGLVLHDDRPSTKGKLMPGHRLQIGDSVWRIRRVPGGPGHGIVQWANSWITAFVGIDEVRGFNVEHFLSAVFRPRGDTELESHFSAGFGSTNPTLQEISTDWPQPWAFVRVLGLLLIACVCFMGIWVYTQNPLIVPGLLIFGAFAAPWALLVLFYEMNTPRNVSFYQVVKLFILGTVISMVLTSALNSVTGLASAIGPMAAGPIEEVSKAAVLLLMINLRRYRWTLNGLLFGAAVGAGFSAFESLGYAYDAGVDNLIQRGILEIVCSHILWTSIVGAALWSVRGDRPFEPRMLLRARFLRTLILAIVLHMAWNGFGPFSWIPVGFASWLAVIAYIQAGLKEIRNEQLRTAISPDA